MPSGRLFWDGVPLTAGDAIALHWAHKRTWPEAPTRLERFGLGPDALLTAQAWAIPETPYLPSANWWRKLGCISDRALARVVTRVSALVGGQPPVLDLTWRQAWRECLLPGLLAEVKRRQRTPRRTSRGVGAEPPINVLETMQCLTGEEGRERRGEVWFHCPFHPDRTPSLSLNVEKAIWHCFGCQEGGGWKRLQELAA